MKVPIVISIGALILGGCASHEERESAGASGPIITSEQSTGRSSSYLGEQDQRFLKEAAQGGEAEVQMGRLGAQKGHIQAVRQFGQKLVQDHSKANQELKLLASQKGVTLPSDIPIEQQSMLSHLKSLEGPEFDQAFKKHAVEEHQKAIEKFQTAQQSADADVKAFAQKTLPVLQQHLKMAQDIPTGEETQRQSTTQEIQPSTTTPQHQQIQP
jgi:putative membrane protein